MKIAQTPDQIEAHAAYIDRTDVNRTGAVSAETYAKTLRALAATMRALEQTTHERNIARNALDKKSHVAA